MVDTYFKKWADHVGNWWWLRRASQIEFSLCDASLRPFFIVSAGRSGTTLLRKKLVNSDYVHIPPESDDFIPHSALYFIRNNRKGWSHLTHDILEALVRQPFFQYWAVDASELHDLLQSLPPKERSYANVINLLYIHDTRGSKPALQVWGDKTPYLIYRLEWLRRIFPGARYIHLVRDGRAVVHSMMRYQNYSLERAVTRWKDSVNLFAAHRRRIRPESALEIRYEDFVTSPEKTLREVCAFIGVDYNDNLLKDRGVSLGDDVLPHHENLGKAINTDSIEKWRCEMSSGQIELIDRKLRKELSMLNYNL